MFNLISQATQPAAWRSWGPVEWSTILASFTASIVAVIAAVKSLLESRANRAANSQTVTALQKVADAVDPNVPEATQPGLAEQVRTITTEVK